MALYFTEWALSPTLGCENCEGKMGPAWEWDLFSYTQIGDKSLLLETLGRHNPVTSCLHIPLYWYIPVHWFRCITVFTYLHSITVVFIPLLIVYFCNWKQMVRGYPTESCWGTYLQGMPNTCSQAPSLQKEVSSLVHFITSSELQVGCLHTIKTLTSLLHVFPCMTYLTMGKPCR